jgi:hypothetical protein
MAKNRPAHRPPAYTGGYPYRFHKGISRAPRTPLMGDYESGEENEDEGFGYREIPRTYPTLLGEEKFDSLDEAVTPTNIAIGAALVILGIVAVGYYMNRTNQSGQQLVESTIP